MASKMQAGVSFDSKIWNKFKERFKGKASQELEDYMRWRLENPLEEYPNIYSGSEVKSFNFNLDQWTAQVNSGHLQVNNVTFTAANSTAGTTTDAIQIYHTDARDIKIE